MRQPTVDIRAVQVINAYRKTASNRIIFTCTLNDNTTAYISEFWLQLTKEDLVLAYWIAEAIEKSKEALGEDTDHRHLVTGLDQYHVLKILSHSDGTGRRRMLEVQWCGYSAAEATTEPFNAIWEARKAVVLDYYNRHRLPLPPNLDYEDPETSDEEPSGEDDDEDSEDEEGRGDQEDRHDL
ncbi:unnamed protein product [Fusarium graminearum]|uniref:Chromo domain-containing protein n=1 Tax=Gibberella zeae TaxID=5518 RepID=A0A9N8WZP7_GIBZA|nr:unnamed protein product [Fusarium graminearum]